MVYQFVRDEPYESGVILVVAETKESAIDEVKKTSYGSEWGFDCVRRDIQYVGGHNLPHIFLKYES